MTEVTAARLSAMVANTRAAYELGWGTGSVAMPTTISRGPLWIDPTTRRLYQMLRLTSDTGGGSDAGDVSVEIPHVLHGDATTDHGSDVKVHDKLFRRDTSGRLWIYDLANTRWELEPTHRFSRTFTAEQFTLGTVTRTTVSGSNFDYQLLDFDDATTEDASLVVPIPALVAGNAFTFTVRGFAAATSGTAKVKLNWLFVPDGAVLDNAAGSTVTLDWTPDATTTELASVASSAQASAVAGDTAGLLHVKVSRLGADGGDDMSGDLRMASLSIDERAY